MKYEIKRLSPSDFPELLQEIPDAPKQLFVRGELPFHDTHRYLCVVGSRAASAYARRACMTLISGLAGMPVVVVSGLALGIDAEAHKAALEAGLPTVAVLPSSIDDSSLYPSMNRALGAHILTTGGALVSEYEPRFKPQQWSFPSRNRIMAGLSHAALLVEAGEKSGTLITARLALDYNREVLAVPHEIGAERGAGSNRLIHEGGARLVRSSEDVLEALGLTRPSTSSGQMALPSDLTEPEQKVMLALIAPLTHDELIERTALVAQHANIAISSLAIRGLIIERLGKIERV